MNKLQCPLCRQMFNQPCMCPHCSEVYCKKCIKKYLQDFYFCPSCDRHIIDLIDCSRLINQVKQKIKQSDLKKAKQSSVVPLEQCIEHSLPLKYYCLTCKMDICSDCGLISQKHKSHTIQPIQTIKPPKNIISELQLRQIKHRISQKLFTYQQQKKRYILQLQLLKSQIKYNKTKIYEYYEDLIMRLERQTEVLLKQIQERIHECGKMIGEKQGIMEKIDELEKRCLRAMMEECCLPLVQQMGGARNYHAVSSVEITDRELYKYLTERNYIRPIQPSHKQQKQRRMSQRRKQIAKKILKKEQPPLSKLQPHKINKKNQQIIRQQSQIIKHQQLSQFFTTNSLLIDKKIYQLGIMKQIYPDYHNFSFQMDYLLAKDQDVVYSPNYKVYGYEWKLKIYPKGNAQAHNSHVSLFLQLINSPQALTSNTPKQYYFRLQLLNLNQAGKSVIKEYNSKFSVGECWGYAQFIQVNQIKQYLHDGKLLFVMGIKNVSYYDECDNMRKYITKLQGETKVLSELCENYYMANNHSHNQSREEERNMINNSGEQQRNEVLGMESSDESLDQQLGNRGILPVEGLERHHFGNEDDISSIISSFDGDNGLGD